MDTESSTFSIHSTLRNSPPISGLPFLDIKERVLGRSYSLSLVFVGDQRSRQLNAAYRNKDKPADVLSFPLADDAGELFINPREAARRADDFDMSLRDFIGFLFIHGCLHLKGHVHGSTMEKAEQRLKDAFLLR